MDAPRRMTAGWYQDPTRRHERRYHDGQQWTRRVVDNDVIDEDPQPLPAEHAAAAGTVNAPSFWATRRWANLFSIRALIGSALVALIPAVPAGLLWPPLGTAAFIVAFVLAHLFIQMAPERVLYCPHCRKRVKMDATTCHHCGQRVVP
jgi:hypothetical protein